MARREFVLHPSPTKSAFKNRRGLTLVELFVVIAIVGLLLSMLLPTVRHSRGPARRAVCLNNLRQIILASHNYQSSNLELPMAIGIRDQSGQLQTKRISGLVSILPFMDSGLLHDQITTSTAINGVEYPAFGPEFSDQSYPPWSGQIPGLLCPSGDYKVGPFGQKNYAFSIGDTARQIYQPKKLRGPFGAFKSSNFDDVLDGSSNTTAIVEMGSAQINSIRGGFITGGKPEWLDNPGEIFSTVDKRQEEYKTSDGLGGRGSHWANGSAGISLVNTILPPGSPSFLVSGNRNGDGVYSAGSGHPGGINIALVDGSARFISNQIDAGDPATPTLTTQQIESDTAVASPHGVWGALGTMAGGDDADYEF